LVTPDVVFPSPGILGLNVRSIPESLSRIRRGFTGGGGLIAASLHFCPRLPKPADRVQCLLVLALCIPALPALAQQASGHPASDPPSSDRAQPENPSSEPVLAGSVSGVVVDRDGTAYEGAQIELIAPSPFAGESRPSARTATSDSAGRFNFMSVPCGPFQLTVSSAGFATQTISGVLHPSESYEGRPIVLPITASSEVVVTASTEEIAEAQVKVEEQQRVLGVIPNFYVAYEPDAAPLTTRQKFDLAWRSSIDPVSFLSAGGFAGIQQATNSFSGYGQGAQGYAKRYGANYADIFIGTMVGGALFPALLKQDPRYFYKGTGTVPSRALYAIAMSVVCRGDNGRWEPAYSGILGGLAAGGISNLYYPASNREGAELTFENAAIGIAEGAVENLLQEFVVRKLTPKVPNYNSAKP
jgi:hypothetical protein